MLNIAQNMDQLTITDVSQVPRFGVRGSGANDWLASMGLALPDKANRAIIDKACVIARLSANEYLLQAFEQKIPLCNLLASSEKLTAVYDLPRQHSHAALLLSGAKVPELFSTLSAVDLRSHKFANGQVAQTSLANANAILVRCDKDEQLRYLYLFDSALLMYIGEVLLDAVQVLID